MRTIYVVVSMAAAVIWFASAYAFVFEGWEPHPYTIAAAMVLAGFYFITAAAYYTGRRRSRGRRRR